MMNMQRSLLLAVLLALFFAGNATVAVEGPGPTGGDSVNQAGQAAAVTCEDAAVKAKGFCNPYAFLGAESPAEAAMFDMLLQKTVDLGTMAKSMGGSTEKSCDLAAKVQGFSAALNSGRALTCRTMIGSCTSTCLGEAKALRAMQENTAAGRKEAQAAICKKMNAFWMANLAQAMTNAASMVQSLGCERMAKAQAANDPTSSSTSVDCNNEKQKTTVLQCICEANPRDPKCGSLNGSSGGLNLASRATNTDPTAPGQGEEEYEDPNYKFNAASVGGDTPGSNSVGQASSGGVGGGGGGSGGSFGGEEEQGGVGPNNASVIQGYGSGSGGFNYAKGGSQGGSDDKLRGLASKFDLSKFFPKNKGDALAGMIAVRKKDGVTGPTGPSIWEKVSRQYQVKKYEMMPP